MLEDISRCSCFESADSIGHIGVHGKEDNLDLVVDFFDLPDGIDAVQERHGDVRHDHVRPQLRRCGEQRAAVLDDANKLELRLKQAFEAFGHDPVIVCQQDARPVHVPPPASGTRTVITAPSPGRDRTANSPWTSNTRSRMLERPSPGMRLASWGSNPMPSSVRVTESAWSSPLKWISQLLASA